MEKDFISKYMALWVLLAATLSMLFPTQMGIVKTAWVTPLLGIVMFGMGLTLKLEDFRVVFTKPKEVILGCVAQFTIMPLMAWLLTRCFGLPAELAVGVILVGCCPGGTSSNVITYLAGGDLALSVGMTSVSTLLAPLMTPLLTWLLAGTYVDVDVWAMLWSIVQVIILPIAIGLLVKHYLPKQSKQATNFLPAVSTIAITLIVIAVVSANAAKLLSSGLLIMVVVVLHNLCGYGLGYLLGLCLHLTSPKTKAISIEVGMQNSGLACSLATQHFASLALATVPGAVFSVWHNISGSLLARILRDKR